MTYVQSERVSVARCDAVAIAVARRRTATFDHHSRAREASVLRFRPCALSRLLRAEVFMAIVSPLSDARGPSSAAAAALRRDLPQRQWRAIVVGHFHRPSRRRIARRRQYLFQPKRAASDGALSANAVHPFGYTMRPMLALQTPNPTLYQRADRSSRGSRPTKPGRRCARALCLCALSA